MKILGLRDQRKNVAQAIRSEEQGAVGTYTDLGQHIVESDAHHPKHHHLDHEEGGVDMLAVSDSMLGERGIADAEPPTADVGTLSTLLGWLAYMLKSITGKSSWRSAPACSLEEASIHINSGSKHLVTSCKVASVANLILSGEQMVDGVACGIGDRVLVKNQTDPRENGIYLVSAGLWSRAGDLLGDGVEQAGLFVYIKSGIVNNKQEFHLTTIGPIILGTTSLSFENIDQGGGGAGSGDMLKAIYDANGDGVVDRAAHALTADNATTAGYAGSAGSALSATTAGHATTATSAEQAQDATRLGGQLPAFYARADEMLKKDGSVAMTGPLLLSAEQPAEANHAISKDFLETTLRVYASNLAFYDDGLVVTFSDSSVSSYLWVKDENGRLTNLTNITPEPDEVTNITYNAGNRP